MDIEEIKEWRKLYWDTDDEKNLGEIPVIDWLIAEAERLKAYNEHLINWIESMTTLEPKNTIKRIVATRCAEIADNEKYNYPSPDSREDVCLDIYESIRKEFKLDE